MERPKEPIADLQEELSAIEEAEAEFMLSQIKAVIKNDKRLKKGKRTEMESFSDYPQSVSKEYYKTGDTEACGYISYLLWGGKSAKTWAESKIKQDEKKK